MDDDLMAGLPGRPAECSSPGSAATRSVGTICSGRAGPPAFAAPAAATSALTAIGCA